MYHILVPLMSFKNKIKRVRCDFRFELKKWFQQKYSSNVFYFWRQLNHNE